MTTTLRLIFSSEPSLSLHLTEFECPLTKECIRSVRGKNSSSDAQGSFQWTSAVQALTLFFVYAKLHSGTSRDGFVYRGDGGTPAASLDYAISKQPIWLLEMFGTNSQGTPTIRRIITRFNPERKRGGDVGLGLNTRFLAPTDVQIILDKKELTHREDLQQLAHKLVKGWKGRGKISAPTEPAHSTLAGFSEPGDLAQSVSSTLTETSRLPSPFCQPKTWNIIFHHYMREVRGALRKTNIFTRYVYTKEIADMVNNPSVQALAGKEVRTLLELKPPSLSSDRLALHPSLSASGAVISETTPLRIAVSPAHAGTLAILTYLRDFRKLPIEIDYRYPHSVSLAQRMVDQNFSEESPELFSLTVATASTILHAKLQAYTPFLLMPKQSHRVIRPKKYASAKQTFERYLFMQDIPATESFYFDDMVREGALADRKYEAVHMEPDDVTWLLSEGDPELRAIIGFPHYTFNILFNYCEAVDPPDVSYALKPTILFHSQSLAAQPQRKQAAEMLIRDGWLTLKGDTQLLQRVIARLLHDTEYLQVLKRCVGLHALPISTTPSSDKPLIRTKSVG